ncbi:Dabb family protein [Ahrensia sp. R2A130]|uniref:Dabb family protein n=1 Tax=Ahrensia sp. R2A130 TaxID=744979 RepID=UPI0001E0842A|nr:Dabb family protein [Ahrensia sp. R2A130]EFL88069.1 stress responsive alpha-beta protein [Ahrensia sp. R2A130]
MILHCVLLDLRDEAGAELSDAMHRLTALVGVIPGMTAFRHGPNRDFEGLSQDYAYGFVVEFDNASDLTGYAEHPEHKAIGEVLVGLCAGGVAGIQVSDIDVA